MHDDDQPCCETNEPCCSLRDWEPDADDLAVSSLCGGLVSLILAMSAYGTWLHFVGLMTGFGAIGAGYQALKQHTRLEKQATTGLICGSLAVAMWLVCSAVHEVRVALGGQLG